MIIVYGLFIYSIFEMLKFLVCSTIGDLIFRIKGTYHSPERDQAVNGYLWMAGKSILAFVIACFLVANL